MSFQYVSADTTSKVACNLECRRCQATVAKGNRQCSKTTCKFLPYCFVHLRTELNLEVRVSTIPNSGFGLFTLIDRDIGDFIAPYHGRLLTLDQMNSMYGNATNDLGPYVVKMGANKYMDTACMRSAGSFANANPSHNNAKLAIDNAHNTVNIKATKRIKAGEEVFLSYGSHYFARKNNLPKPVYSTSTRKIKDEIPALPQAEFRTEVRKTRTRGLPSIDEDRKVVTQWTSGKLEVKTSTIPNAGHGLFAHKLIKAGETITCIENPVELSAKEAEAEGFPHDSIVFTKVKPPKGRQFNVSIFDASWTSPAHPPIWYFMNHAAKGANAEMYDVVIGGKPSVCWKAREDIRPGSEIMFNYEKGKTLRF